MSGDYQGGGETGSIEWGTPQKLFDRYHAEFGFTLDAAASSVNRKCERYLGVHTDGLVTPWGTGERVWLNPPYGQFNLAKWVPRAFEQSRLGNVVACLLPARTDAGWFHDYALPHAEIRFLRGRVKFAGAPNKATFPSLVAIFRP